MSTNTSSCTICSAPNVYIFVYILIETRIAHLSICQIAVASRLQLVFACSCNSSSLIILAHNCCKQLALHLFVVLVYCCVFPHLHLTNTSSGVNWRRKWAGSSQPHVLHLVLCYFTHIYAYIHVAFGVSAHAPYHWKQKYWGIWQK